MGNTGSKCDFLNGRRPRTRQKRVCPRLKDAGPNRGWCQNCPIEASKPLRFCTIPTDFTGALGTSPPAPLPDSSNAAAQRLVREDLVNPEDATAGDAFLRPERRIRLARVRGNR